MPARRMARLVISRGSNGRLLVRRRPTAPYAPFSCVGLRAEHASCACRDPAREEPTAELRAAAEEDETDEEFFDAEEPETDEPAADGRTYTNEQTRHIPFCLVDGCNTLAVPTREGVLEFCIKHGGGLRCLAPGCGSSALTGKGLRQYCGAHGPQCVVDGCTRCAKMMVEGRALCRQHRHR